MLQSSAYRQKRRPRRVSSLSRSSSTRLLKRGESGPPCGVPSFTGRTKPSSITPALRYARMSLSTRLSATRAATRAISAVEINHEAVASGNVALRLGYRLMGGASRTEAVAVLRERRVPTLLQDLQQRLLD